MGFLFQFNWILTRNWIDKMFPAISIPCHTDGFWWRGDLWNFLCKVYTYKKVKVVPICHNGCVGKWLLKNLAEWGATLPYHLHLPKLWMQSSTVPCWVNRERVLEKFCPQPVFWIWDLQHQWWAIYPLGEQSCCQTAVVSHTKGRIVNRSKSLATTDCPQSPSPRKWHSGPN